MTYFIFLKQNYAYVDGKVNKDIDLTSVLLDKICVSPIN